MIERPTLFTGSNVCRIREDAKTQTRRLLVRTRLRVQLRHEVRSDPPFRSAADILRASPGVYPATIGDAGAVYIRVGGELGKLLGVKPGEFDFVCPYVEGVTHLGLYGEGRQRWTITPSGTQRLYVRETWAVGRAADRHPGSALNAAHWLRHGLWYPADGTVPAAPSSPRGRTRSARFMPRWASRTLLDVVSVRLERLNDLSEEDAIAEGVERAQGPTLWPWVGTKRKGGLGERNVFATAVGAFTSLWNEINGERCPWSLNDWVWAVTFRRVEERQAKGGLAA